MEPRDDRPAPARGAARRLREYEEYAQLVNDDSTRRSTLRGLMRFREAPDGGVPVEEVEPAQEIVKALRHRSDVARSLIREAHETRAVAMNRIGGRSNTGEGGEDPVRYVEDPNGDSRRSAIKQVASGRFGVTRTTLATADELTIKMAQGAKPARAGSSPPQGRPLHRERSADDTRRRPHLAAAHQRHLFDRGSQAADLRPALRESRGARLREARLGGRCRDGCRRRRQGQRDHVLISGHDGGTGASSALVDSFAAPRGRSGSPRRSRRWC